MLRPRNNAKRGCSCRGLARASSFAGPSCRHTDDFANGIIAKRIIELARAGERRPDLLCEGALKTLSGNLFGD